MTTQKTDDYKLVPATCDCDGCRAHHALQAKDREIGRLTAQLKEERELVSKMAARAEAAEAKLAAAQEELRRIKWHPEKANP